MGVEMNVCVLGGVNAGKSTILNAIVGGELFPSSDSVETATFTTIRYAKDLPDGKVTSTMLDNEKVLSLEEAQKWIQEKNEEARTSSNDVSQHFEFEGKIARLTRIIETLQIQKFSITDCPGANEARQQSVGEEARYHDQIAEILETANIVIVITDHSQAESTTVDDMAELVRLHTRDDATIALFVNKMDDPTDPARVEEKLKGRFNESMRQELFGGRDSMLLFTRGRDALLSCCMGECHFDPECEMVKHFPSHIAKMVGDPNSMFDWLTKWKGYGDAETEKKKDIHEEIRKHFEDAAGLADFLNGLSVLCLQQRSGPPSKKLEDLSMEELVIVDARFCMDFLPIGENVLRPCTEGEELPQEDGSSLIDLGNRQQDINEEEVQPEPETEQKDSRGIIGSFYDRVQREFDSEEVRSICCQATEDWIRYVRSRDLESKNITDWDVQKLRKCWKQKIQARVKCYLWTQRQRDMNYYRTYERFTKQLFASIQRAVLRVCKEKHSEAVLTPCFQQLHDATATNLLGRLGHAIMIRFWAYEELNCCVDLQSKFEASNDDGWEKNSSEIISGFLSQNVLKILVSEIRSGKAACKSILKEKPPHVGSSLSSRLKNMGMGAKIGALGMAIGAAAACTAAAFGVAGASAFVAAFGGEQLATATVFAVLETSGLIGVGMGGVGGAGIGLMNSLTQSNAHRDSLVVYSVVTRHIVGSLEKEFKECECWSVESAPRNQSVEQFAVSLLPSDEELDVKLNDLRSAGVDI